MFPINFNFDKTVKTSRLVDVEDTEKEEYEDYLEEVACHIQPLDESYSEDLKGNFGKDYLMFCEIKDIIQEDKVVDGTDEYKVVGVEKYDFLDQSRHMEVRLRKYLT